MSVAPEGNLQGEEKRYLRSQYPREGDLNPTAENPTRSVFDA